MQGRGAGWGGEAWGRKFQRWPLLSCQDIAGRFMAQKKCEENLQQQIAESEKKRRGLKSQLKALELQRAELTFHQSLGFLRYLPPFRQQRHQD